MLPTSRRSAARATACGLALVVTAGVVSATLAAGPAAAAGGGRLTMYGGYAYGTSGHIGSYTHSGRSAVTTLCTSRAGVSRSNHSGATTIPQVGTVGAVTTRMHTARPDSGPVSLATTKTSGVSLFGMIRASAITTTTRVARTADGITRTGNTGFVGLSVAGHASPPAHPSVGQKMAIPGVATIVFNRHLLSNSFGSYRMTVIAMTVTIPKNNTKQLPAGTIVIGRGASSLHRKTFANASGYAFGSSVHAAKLAGSGRTAAVYLPCGGTSGGTARNRVSKGYAPKVVRTGAVSSTGASHDAAGATTARTTNATARPRLFGGIIKARSVRVIAQATRTSSMAVDRSGKASFAGLVVNGQHRSSTAPANTKINIPNLGTLWIHRVITTPAGVIVRGLDLVLSVTKNGLKRGTELIVGAAHAAVSAR